MNSEAVGVVRSAFRGEVTKAPDGMKGDIAEMRLRQHVTRTLTLMVPVATSQVSDMLVHTADSIMVGHLGASALAGVTLATSAAIIFLLFAVGFSAAITPLAGEAVGRRNMADAARYVRAGALVSTVITAILVAGLLAFSPWFHLLGAPADVTAQAVPYFRWIAASALFRIWFGAFKQSAEALSNTRAAMIINVATNVLNVGLNWVFIYGHLGAPEMGAEGAGLATFLARGSSVVLAWVVYRRSSFFADLRAHIHDRVDPAAFRQAMRRILGVGTGIGLQIVVEILGFASGAIMMGWIGATALAAHQVAINPASITFMVALGLSSAATIRVSTLRGEGDLKGAHRAGQAALALVVGYMLIVAVLYALLRYQIPHLYISDPAVVELAATLLLWAGAFSLFDGLQVVGLGILRGYNDIRIPTILAVVSYLVITIPAGYIAAFVYGMGPSGIWLGYLIGLTFAGTTYVWRISRLEHHPEEMPAIHVGEGSHRA